MAVRRVCGMDLVGLGLDFKTKSKWVVKQIQNKLADRVLNRFYATLDFFQLKLLILVTSVSAPKNKLFLKKIQKKNHMGGPLPPPPVR